MKICNLASGSKGNMTYLETKEGKFLIDAGISIKCAKERKPEIDFSSIDGLFITHEHSDHIGYLDTVAKKTKAVIYISRLSYNALKKEQREKLAGLKLAFIEGESLYEIKDLKVYTFNMSHDAASTFGFIFEDATCKFGYFTDTGFFPIRYKSYLKDLDIFMIEANHNIEMLQNSDRTYYVINRILSSTGHMSNQACYELLSDVMNEKNRYVLLSHISQDCNSIDMLREEIINKLEGKNRIALTNQFDATPIYEI